MRGSRVDGYGSAEPPRRYAPAHSDGSLPPGFADQSLAQAFKSCRQDFRPKKLLRLLGEGNGSSVTPQLQLRSILDTVDGRARLRDRTRQAPPLHEAIYRRLRSSIFAEHVYRDIIEPAEVDRESATFLEPKCFTARLDEHRELFRHPDDAIKPESAEDALAQFVLAYGLLQPNDGPALVDAACRLGDGFRQYFGVGLDARSTEPRTAHMTDTMAEPGQSPSLLVDELDARLSSAAKALTALASKYAQGRWDGESGVVAALQSIADLRATVVKLVERESDAHASLDSISACRLRIDETKAEETIREGANAVLSRATTIAHLEQPATELLASLRNVLVVTGEALRSDIAIARELVDGGHPVSQLLRLIDELDHLTDADEASLKKAVAEAFGEPLARAASRGRLRLAAAAPLSSPAEEPPVPAEADSDGSTASTSILLTPPETPAPTKEQGSAPREVGVGPSLLADSIGEPEPVPLVIGVRANETPVAGASVRRADERLNDTPSTGGGDESDPHASEELAPEGEEGPRQAENEPDEGMLAPDPDGHLTATAENTMWQLIEGGRLGLAYQLCATLETIADGRSPVGVRRPVTAAILESLLLSPFVRAASGGVVDDLHQRLGEVTAVFPSIKQGHGDVVLVGQLLVLSAILRPAVFGSSTHATTLLASVTLPGEGFHAIQTAIVRQAKTREGLTPALLKGMREIASWEQEFRAHAERCRRWLEQNRLASIIYAPTTDVWRQWLQPSVSLGAALEIAATTDPARALSRAAEVVDASRVWSRPAHVDNTLKRTDKALRGRAADLRPIEARAATAIAKRVHAAVSLLEEWNSLVAVRPLAGLDYQQRTIDRFRQEVISSLPLLRGELMSACDRLSSEDVRGAVAATTTRAIDDIDSLFDPSVVDTSPAVDARALRGRDLLGLGDVVLDENWQPSNTRDVVLLDRLMVLASAPPVDLVQALEARLAAHDHVACGWILDLLDADAHPRAEELRARRDRDLVDQRNALQKGLARVSADMVRAASYELLSEAELLDMKANIDATEPARVLVFGPAFARVERVGQTIETRTATRLEEVRARLESKLSGVSGETKARIEQALAAGNFLAANEYIDLTIAGRPIPEAPVDSVFDSYFPDFVRQTRTLFSSHQSVTAIVNEVRNGKSIGPLDMAGVRPPQAQSAARMLEAWFGAKGRLGLGRLKEQLEQLFGDLGFDSVAVTGPVLKDSDRRWRGDLQATPLGDRDLCVLPQFGSAARGHYQVLCTWDRPSEDEIVSATAAQAAHVPLLVLYFGQMSEQGRRELTHLSRRRRRTFLLVDETVVFFLCGARGLRLPLLFQSLLPFTLADPYITTASLVPPEMFFGRSAERESVIGQYGTNLIYGGRQLGKTALLRDVERSYHRPHDGAIVKWIDLRAEQIGITKPIEDLWLVIANALHGLSVMSSRTGSPEEVTRQTAEWLAEGEQRRIVLLLDEADAFLESDGKGQFEHVSRIKHLMDSTDRRFKVVFAGLHNVQRTSRDVNTPLGHLGQPICIGPLLNAREAREALTMITKPLGDLGYRFESPDLPMRIVSHTNYYPSLIQIYGKHLLEYLTDPGVTRFDPKSTPPYVITQRHLDAVQNDELRARILDKFRLTLDLDPRYRLIALCIAMSAADGNGTAVDIGAVDPAWVRQEALYWWEEGFERDSSLEAFKTILDEMIGLGILRRVGGQYQLRSPNLANLLGTRREIEEQLLDASNREPPIPYEQSDFRRVLADDANARSPLTAQQESVVFEPSTGVCVLSGSELGELSALPRFLGVTPAHARLIALEAVPDAAGFQSALAASLRGPRDKPLVVVVDSGQPWNERWIQRAVDLLEKPAAKRGPVRVIFVADGAKAWAWVATEPARQRLLRRGVTELAVKPWGESALRRWLDDLGIALHDSEARREIADRTGAWPRPLRLFGEQCQAASHRWREHLVALEREMESTGTWFEALQVPSVAVPVLRVLADYGGAMSFDEVMQLGANLEPERVNRALRWVDLMNYARTETGDRRQLNPVVGRILAATSRA